MYEGYVNLGRAIAGIRDKLTLSYIDSSNERGTDIAPVCSEGYLKALGTDHTDVFIIQFCDKLTEYNEINSENGLLAYTKKYAPKDRRDISALAPTAWTSRLRRLRTVSLIC